MYLIPWTDEAFDEMDRIVRENPGRTAELASALRRLADRLGSHAPEAGESRWGDLRVIIVHPLTVYFRVDVTGRSAEVAQVRLTG